LSAPWIGWRAGVGEAAADAVETALDAAVGA